MKKLTKDIKRILSALAYQDAAEFLPMRKKLEIFGVGTSKPKTPGPKPVVTTRMEPAPKRVALIIHKHAIQATFDYAQQACVRLGAQLDLLFAGPAKTADVDAMEKRLRHEGLAVQRFNLPDNLAKGIENYIQRHPSVVYLVAAQNNPIVREYVEHAASLQGVRLPMPLVLIEEKTIERLSTASMAISDYRG